MWNFLPSLSLSALKETEVITFTEIVAVLLLSAYAPSLAGINCDGNCSVMASGNAPYEGALACPAWIPLGTAIELSDSPSGPMTGICEDRGGMVVGNKVDYCLISGDVAARARAWGRRAVASTIKCWGCDLPMPRSIRHRRRQRR